MYTVIEFLLVIFLIAGDSMAVFFWKNVLRKEPYLYKLEVRPLANLIDNDLTELWGNDTQGTT